MTDSTVPMTPAWSRYELQLIGAARELQIAVKRTDGTLHRWTPIWVVCAEGGVYVRTWYRRDTGWFGSARRSHSARIRVPGLEASATIKDLGEGPAELLVRVDTAYRDRYGLSGSSSMVGPVAAATTLRLTPQS